MHIQGLFFTPREQFLDFIFLNFQFIVAAVHGDMDA